MDGARALQVDAAELGLIGRQVLQATAEDAPRRRPLGAPLQTLRPDEMAVRTDRDRVGGSDPADLRQQQIGLVGSAQSQLELRGQQRGGSGRGRQLGLGELGGQAAGVGQQPAGGPAGSLVGLQQHQLGGPTPAVVAVSTEPVPGAAGQPSRVQDAAGQQGDFSAGQVDLAEVLPAPVAAEQLSGFAEGVVGLVRQTGRQQHP